MNAPLAPCATPAVQPATQKACYTAIALPFCILTQCACQTHSIYQPEIVLANAVFDRHPDHGRASELIYDSCFLAGLPKVETTFKGGAQSAWRPNAIYHFIQSRSLTPDFVIDVSDFWEIKMKAVLAYKSQFHDPQSQEPSTFISSPQFLKLVEARGVEYGQIIGAQYGEGYTVRKALGVKSLFDIF